jgi:3-oxoacyl-(acyl-carrier-protein) synthase
VPESCKATAGKLTEIWNMARVLVTYLPHITSKIKAVIEEYNLTMKNRSRASEAQKSHEREFMNKINKLFDISHQNARQMIRIEEDRLF